MIDLSIAIACVKTLHQQNPRKRYEVGLLVKDVPGFCSLHKKGNVVIFVDDGDKEVTVHTPMSQEWIAKERARGSLICTTRTMVGVPISYLERIKL